MSGGRAAPSRDAAIPALVGVIVAAATGLAMWRSPAPWTFTLDTGSVFLGQTLPAFRRWFAGEIPEWSDLLWGGFPLIGDCTTAALYPLHALAYLATRAAPLRFFDAAWALHLGIFAAGSAYLVRTLGAGAMATALAGVLAALSPFGHYCAIAFFPVFGAQAWWPWAFASAERLAQPTTPALGGAMVLGAVALAAQVLVGVPEQATYCAIVTAVWLVVRRSPLGVGARLVRLALLGLGALALSAPQLFPTLALLPWTARAEAPGHAELASLYLTEPLRLVVPWLGAMNATPSFLGAAALVLAAIAVAGRRRRAALLVIVAVLAFSIATGPEAGLYAWLRRVPPFDHFRNPIKIYALAEFAIVWAAALGADVLWARRSATARALAATLVLAAVGERAVFVAGTLPLFAGIRARDGLTPAFYETLAASVPARAHHDGKPPPVLYDACGQLGGGCVRSVGALVGISSLRAGTVALVSPINLEVFRWNPAPSRLTLLGVRYLVAGSDKCARLESRMHWKLVEENEEFCVFENPVRTERFGFLGAVTAVATEREMIDLVQRPNGTVPVVAPSDVGTSTRPGVVAQNAYAPGRMSLLVVAREPGLVLVRDSFAPGWVARVDGRAIVPYPAVGVFFAVPVTTGLHTITLAYRAPGLRPGLAFAAAWLVVVSASIVLRRRVQHRLVRSAT